MKRRPECLPVLSRSNNWREWNMKRWRMTGKGPKSPLVTNIPRKLLSSTRIILKNHESTPINTERKLQPHPRIIFARLPGGARVAKCLSQIAQSEEKLPITVSLEERLNYIFGIFPGYNERNAHVYHYHL